MLDLDPEVIADLIDESEKLLKPHFDQMDELERWLLSRGYGNPDDFDGGQDWPENVPYSFVSMLMSRMTHAAPQFSFTGGGSKAMREQTLGLQDAMNLLARQTRLHLTLAPAAMDYLLGFTCIYVDCESQPAHKLTRAQRRLMKGKARYVPGQGDQRVGPRRSSRDYTKPSGPPRYYDSATPTWPMGDHLVRHSYGWDQTARTWNAVRYFWHDVVEDLEDTLARCKADPEHWDEEAILRLGQVSRSDNPYLAGSSTTRHDQVKQVKYRMVFVPEGRITEDEFDPDSGEPRKVAKEPGEFEHGVWLTIGCVDGGSASYSRGRRFGEQAGADDSITPTRSEFLAKPFYRRGSKNPPYHIFGAHIPASKTVPFSPLTANHEQIRLWNDLSAAVQRRMRRYSRQVLYNLMDETTIEAILEAKDDDFVGIPGFETGRAQVVERGGMSQQDTVHLQTSQQTVYRGLGMSETLQGNATGNTATAEGYAAQTGLARVGLVLNGWENGVAGVALDQTYHIAHNDDFWVVLDEAAKINAAMADMAPFIEAGLLDAQTAEQIARQAAQQEIAIWQGGDFASDPSLDFALLKIEIEPQSMERRDLQEQRQDVLALVPLIQMVGDATIMQPHIEWREILRLIGKVFRQPDAHKWLRMDIAQQMSQLMLAQGLADVQMGGSLPSGTQKQGEPKGGFGTYTGGGGKSSSPNVGRTDPTGKAKPMGNAATKASPAGARR